MAYIAQNYLTASKRSEQWLQNQPKSCYSGSGHMVHTSRGSYIDFCCALGANYNGIENSYSLPTSEEELLAKKLCKITGMEKVKLLKTGSEACSAAVRIARGYNNNEHGCGTGYHGIGNTFIADEDPATGCVWEYYTKEPGMDELLFLIRQNDGFSYCIIEPFELDWSPKRIKQLKELRRLCSAKKIILIFDEVITFGRTPSYSVANYTGVQPDLLIGSKALGNGYPISFVAGKSSIMEGSSYFISGTFFGELSGIQAALNTLEFITPKRIQNLWDRGLCFQKKLNAINGDLQLYGLPTRAIWRGKYVLPFIQGMADKGYLLHPGVWFLNHTHTATVLNQFLKNARWVLDEIEAGRIRLNGPEPKPVFKRNNDE